MEKRNNTYLSGKDEFVPEKYIPLTEIFSDGSYALPGNDPDRWCLGSVTLDNMRRATFREVKRRYELSGANTFASFWNGNLDAINQMGLNQFSKLSSFKDLAGSIICFDHIVLNSKKTHKINYVSFGIKKEIYERYYMELKHSISEGRLMKDVNTYDPKKRRLNDTFQTQKTTIRFDSLDPKRPYLVAVAKNELFLRFEKWCNLNRIKKSDAIYEAIKLIMEQNPIEELEPLESFKIKSGITTNQVVFLGEKSQNKKFLSEIPTNIYNDMCGIIRRFNLDPVNADKKRLSISTYVAQAVLAFNKSVPLKYINPELYDEYKKVKESEKYNEKF